MKRINKMFISCTIIVLGLVGIILGFGINSNNLIINNTVRTTVTNNENGVESTRVGKSVSVDSNDIYHGSDDEYVQTYWGSSDTRIWTENFLALTLVSPTNSPLINLGNNRYCTTGGVVELHTRTSTIDRNGGNSGNHGRIHSYNNEEWFVINGNKIKEGEFFLQNVPTNEDKFMYNLGSGVYDWSFYYYMYGKPGNEIFYGDIDLKEVNKSGHIEIVVGNNTGGLISTNSQFSGDVSKLDKQEPLTDLGEANESVSFTLNGWDANKNISGVARAELDGATYNSGDRIEKEGDHVLIVTDNKGQTRTVNFRLNITFATNYNDLKNSYTVGSYWEANLGSYFNNVSGKYNLVSEQDMWDFCYGMEIKQRVKYNGNGAWTYIAANNANADVVYDNREELIKVINYYCAKLYGKRKTIVENKTIEFERPMRKQDSINNDGGGLEWYDYNMDLTVMTDNQAKILPDNIKQYGDGTYVNIRGTYVFSKKDSGKVSPYKDITATYLNDDGSLGRVNTIGFNTEFNSGANFNNGEYLNGYYLITESDYAGNIRNYVVKVDKITPSIEVKIYDSTLKEDCDEPVLNEQGEPTFDNQGNPITEWVDHTRQFGIDAGSNEVVQGTSFYFYALQLESITSTDNINAIKINGGQYANEYFLSTDKLPLISSATSGKGEYTITVFNRGGNSYSFSVIIAGRLPYATYSGLTGNKDAVFSIAKGESYNAILDIKIVKTKSSGEKVQILEDDYGTTVNAYSLEYIFSKGGKFTISVLDMFGEWVEFKSIFFTKGLPVGDLKGTFGNIDEVDNYTRKDVSFIYNKNDVLTVTKNGIVTNEYESSDIEGSENKKIIIQANLDNSNDGSYKIKLNNADDVDLYIDYEFRMRTKVSAFKVLYKDVTDEGNDKYTEINTNSSINKPITIDWSEGGVLVYYAKGAGFENRLQKGQLINEDGDYTIRIRDSIGNELSFSMKVKLAVKYEIVGKYSIYNGKILTNQVLKISVAPNECSVFTITNEYGEGIDTSGSLTKDGEYSVHMEDYYNNSVDLVIIVMRNLPTVVLYGVEEGGVTRTEVYAMFSSEQVGKLYVKNNNGQTLLVGDYKAGEIIKNNGKYKLVVTDIASNERVVEFIIKTEIDIETNVINGAITTNSVSIKELEPLVTTVVFNGEIIDKQSKYILSGGYEITMQDNYGNILELKFSIVAKRSMFFEYVIPKFVDIDYISKDSQLYDYSIEGNILRLSDNGKYIISLINLDTKELFRCEIEVDNVKPILDIEGLDLNTNIAKGSIKIISVSKQADIYVTYKGKEQKVSIGYNTSESGSYTIRVIDDIGNEQIYNFELEFKLNTSAIVLISVGVGLVATVGLIIIIRRRGVKVR